MKINLPKLSKEKKTQISSYLNVNLVRNVLFFGGGIILFIAGVIVYGIIINIHEVPLRQAMVDKGFVKLDDPNIVVDRRTYSLKLYEDTVLIKTYRANFGRNVNVPKNRAGDLATPVGDYAICEMDRTDKYYKFLKINYPNISDATDALRKGIISQQQFDKLKDEFYRGLCPDPDTQLGGDIGIHGIGRLDYIFRYLPFNYNWTDGSIAISNENIDELYSIVKKGTKVVIK